MLHHRVGGNHNVVIHVTSRTQEGRKVEVIESTADPRLLCRGHRVMSRSVCVDVYQPVCPYVCLCLSINVRGIGAVCSEFCEYFVKYIFDSLENTRSNRICGVEVVLSSSRGQKYCTVHLLIKSVACYYQ